MAKKLNLNSAEAEELAKVRGIGPRRAEEIVNYREMNGQFSSIEELKNIPGWADTRVDDFKDKFEV